MKSGLLLFCCLLLVWPVYAQQRVVAGRVTDRSTGQPISGCIVLQSGTTNGISTEDNGVFSLPVTSSAADTLSLVVSYIGYISQRRQVHLGDSAHFGLSADSKELCDLSITWGSEAGLLSGTRYAPVGAFVRVYSSRYMPLISQFQASYQTNLNKNNAASVQIGLPTLHPGHRLTLNEHLNYQWLQAAPRNFRFRAYSASVEAGLYHIGPVLAPDLVVGGGYSNLSELRNGERVEITGFGYTVGLQHALPYPIGLWVNVTATRWPGYWQLQGSAKRSLFGRFGAGVNYNQLREYREVSFALFRYFY
ncbi:carboxypeptidase-like regulatory domain-containing protein [Hymenobacter terrestris]|uniref:Carboxypeptidase-like regulatory domain-containing protein n=1 Tax=Hymenobacter terrestris TaxID=2748310 RepID=A0ABX2Q5Q9_9BACT|nr:carboxypeptidase-like regulatory domain-containing protein [Hymenobacter terrestris]NVO85107.1 carboxypeptidase-like regulatory domain-containing protein [Hymenobacter terrestris]